MSSIYQIVWVEESRKERVELCRHVRRSVLSNLSEFPFTGPYELYISRDQQGCRLALDISESNPKRRKGKGITAQIREWFQSMDLPAWESMEICETLEPAFFAYISARVYDGYSIAPKFHHRMVRRITHTSASRWITAALAVLLIMVVAAGVVAAYSYGREREQLALDSLLTALTEETASGPDGDIVQSVLQNSRIVEVKTNRQLAGDGIRAVVSVPLVDRGTYAGHTYDGVDAQEYLSEVRTDFVRVLEERSQQPSAEDAEYSLDGHYTEGTIEWETEHVRQISDRAQEDAKRVYDALYQQTPVAYAAADIFAPSAEGLYAQNGYQQQVLKVLGTMPVYGAEATGEELETALEERLPAFLWSMKNPKILTKGSDLILRVGVLNMNSVCSAARETLIGGLRSTFGQSRPNEEELTKLFTSILIAHVRSIRADDESFEWKEFVVQGDITGEGLAASADFVEYMRAYLDKVDETLVKCQADVAGMPLITEQSLPESSVLTDTRKKIRGHVVEFFNEGTRPGYVKIQLSGTQIATLFVRSGESVKLKLESGVYRVAFATGDTWYGATSAFGPGGEYSVLSLELRRDTEIDLHTPDEKLNANSIRFESF